MPTNLILVAWAGLAAGCVHVLTGADHMAALLPLSVGRRWRGWSIGARWGIGHSAGVLVIGAGATIFKEYLNVHLIGHWGERVVGVMLIAIGVLGIRWALRRRLHAHPHEHDQGPHVHMHVHGAHGHRASEPAGHPHVHHHAAFLAGIIHGVAGTSHILGVLPAVAMATWTTSGCYLACFAAGTIMAMSAFAAIVGATSSRWSRRGPALIRNLMVGVSCLTIAVGLFWLAMPLLGVQAA